MDTSTAINRVGMVGLFLVICSVPFPETRSGPDFAFSAVPELAVRSVHAQPRPARPRRTPPKPPSIEFRGWDYEKLGQGLSPGEDMALIFLNNLETTESVPITWTLTTYAGFPLAHGQSELSLEPGQTGEVPISLPAQLEDGAYFVRYELGGSVHARTNKFHFDFRRPVPDEMLNLNIVALIENMDAEGWVRMMLGPLAPYVNVKKDWPTGQQPVDAVLVIAEMLEEGEPRLVRLRQYVQQGGKALFFGRPPPSLSEMLPVEFPEQHAWQEKPQQLRLGAGGPWRGFEPDKGPTHYGLRVKAKRDTDVLAVWDDGTPAVVSGASGQGKVVYVGAGSGQVWQRRSALEGADEMGLRLLYWMVLGDGGVVAMLDRAEEIFSTEVRARLAIRDRVLINTGVALPSNFVLVSRDNVGRFGWLTGEGGLTESIAESGVVSTPASRDSGVWGRTPWTADDEASFSFTVGDDSKPQANGIEQNWFSKTTKWRYQNGDIVHSTLSLGSPGLLWEGNSNSAGLSCQAVTHFAYMSPAGIRIVESGGSINPADLAEGWLIGFRADPGVRDTPQLIVLTRKPKSIHFAGGIRFLYAEEGFGALFTSRLWGIRRLAPGQTGDWAHAIPESAVRAARQWSRAFLNYPVSCDEVGWVEDGDVVLADRFGYRPIRSDWGSKPLTFAPLPPVLLLAQRAGAPIQLPKDRTDLECDTKYGPLEASLGDTTLVRITLPPLDHRAIIPAASRMVLREQIDERAAGLRLGQPSRADPNTRNEGSGDLHADLALYDIADTVPFNETFCIDLYKWWLTFNSVLARPVYSDPVREKIDRHFRNRYWETLNFYPHKCVVRQKREPWTGVEYLIHFVWPTQTQHGFRNFNDGNEASGITAYCYAAYARYYGDWATLRANWNHCRRLYEFLPKVNDWACMSSGALEFYQVVGLDMLNSEPWGNLAFAYAAKNAGYPQDELVGLVHGARSLVTAVARFGLQDFVRSVTTEGDPWREYRGFYWFTEQGLQASSSLMGSIGMHDTSKGTNHELSLAYKAWIPGAIQAYEKALEDAGQHRLPDLTQRLFLGWEPVGILELAKSSTPRQPLNWNAATSLYDLALACVADIPLFLSDWAPAEYVFGQYHPERREVNLIFRSHEGESYEVRIYSQRAPREVAVDGESLPGSNERWSYDPESGWLVVPLQGAEEKRLRIVLGEPVAPLHPYFTKVEH